MINKKEELCMDWICPLRKPSNKIFFKFAKKSNKGIGDTNLYCTSTDCEKPLEEVRGKLEKWYDEFGKELAEIIKKEIK